LPAYKVGLSKPNTLFGANTYEIAPVNNPYRACTLGLPSLTPNLSATTLANRPLLAQLAEQITTVSGSKLQIASSLENSMVGEYHFDFRVSLNGQTLVIKDLVLTVVSDGC